MIEIQCTSCQTRYRIDERILPDETPTFKCSRCGHVFSTEPRLTPPRRESGGAAAKPAPRPSAEAAAAAEASAAAAAAPKPPPPPRPPQQQPPPAADQAAAIAAAQAAAARARQASAPERRAAPQPPPTSAAEPPRAASPQAPREEFQSEPVAEPARSRPDIAELLRRRFKGTSADEPATGAETGIPPETGIPSGVGALTGAGLPSEAEPPADEAEKSGENLAFDFNDETRETDAVPAGHAEQKWEVGDADLPPMPPPRPKPRIRVSDLDYDLESTNPERMQGSDAEPDFERIRPEEVSAQAQSLEAELRGRSYKLHSAGYFIGLFALMILGFGIVTVVIQSAPIASAGLLSSLPVVGAGLEPPISPARRVALGQVQAHYAKLKSNQTALVISGTVQNLTSAPLGAVRIEAALTATGTEPLRSQAVYCGNSLSSKMLAEMTPHEIEFFEKLDAPKSFTLAPQTSAPFVIVFIAPPAEAGHYQLRVVSAEPAAAPPPATEGG